MHCYMHFSQATSSFFRVARVATATAGSGPLRWQNTVYTSVFICFPRLWNVLLCSKYDVTNCSFTPSWCSVIPALSTVEWPFTPTAAAGTFLRFFQTIFENTSLWQLNRLVTLSTYRRYINKCIYLSIYLSIYRIVFDLLAYLLTHSLILFP